MDRERKGGDGERGEGETGGCALRGEVKMTGEGMGVETAQNILNY